MTPGFLRILNELHDHHVDFVIVGGVAAALHGGSRATFDLDIVPSLAPDSWQAAVDLLWSLGARPRIPEPLERIRDVEQIRRWRLDENMLALNFHTPDGRTEVDLLVSESDAFSALRQRATEVTVEERTFLVASVDDLIDMPARLERPSGSPHSVELGRCKSEVPDYLEVERRPDLSAAVQRNRHAPAVRVNPPFMAPGLAASDEPEFGGDPAEIAGRRASPSLPTPKPTCCR